MLHTREVAGSKPAAPGIANGREQSVLANRLEFYAMLEDSFRAAVEEAIGRRTSAFLPQLKGDPPIVTALFLLQPEGDGVIGR